MTILEKIPTTAIRTSNNLLPWFCYEIVVLVALLFYTWNFNFV